jgi:phenylacetate-CoA ligase
MHPAVVRNILYPVYRALKRDRVLSYLGEMRKVQRLEPDEVRRYQWKKLGRLLDYACSHVPYYRDIFAGLGLRAEDIRSEEDLRRLPVTRKRDITANPKAFLPEGYPRSHLDPYSTSGSTGESFRFFVGKEACQARQANNNRMNEWSGIRIGDRIAMLWGTAFDVGWLSKLKSAIKQRLSNQIVLSMYRMDESSLEAYVERLKRFQPDMLMGYPSAMAHFAEAILKAGMDTVRPRAIVLSGEALYDWQREVIERAFGTAPFDHYGCREFGAIARECEARQGRHIACERVLLEVAPSGPAAGGGGVGELLVTDLDSFGMPFIRYAMEDLGAVTWERCQCGLGLPRLVETIGRTFDVVRAPNGNALGGTFWTILLKHKKGVERFQVIQEELDKVTIAIKPTSEFSDETRRYILEKVREACGPDMLVDLELKSHLESTPAGKYRFVISRLGSKGEDPGRLNIAPDKS